MDLGELARNIVESSQEAALASASVHATPQVATVWYAANGFELYFETSKATRKYQNFSENALAAVAITQGKDSVQIDGSVKELSGKAADDARERLVCKYGDKEFYHLPDARFFKFTPIRAQVFTQKRVYPISIV